MGQLRCKDCPSRFPGCHGICPNYIEFRKQREELYAQRAEEARGITGYLIDRRHKIAKQRARLKKWERQSY
ncbi:MAG: hypothetical protein J5563_08475 [Clostridia bacterium]|nr:hypothetical protein [Clostridia bacterium]